MGPVRWGMSPEGPAASISWELGNDGQVSIGAGLDWQGKPRIGANIKIRF